MKILIYSFIVTAVFLFLLGCSLYGVVISENVPVRAVGNMQIAPFKNGLSLFQGYRGKFFTFSPFNDYIVNDDGNRSALIGTEEIEKELYQSTFHASKIQDIRSTIEGYLLSTTPAITFRTNETVTYTTKIVGNTVTVLRTISNNGSNNPILSGMTVSFAGTNFIYDPKGHLYSFNAEDDITTYEQVYGISLSQEPLEKLREEIPGKTLIIVNPYISGALIVRAKANQRLFINREAKLIEVEEELLEKDDLYTMSMTVEVYSNPKEVQSSI